MASGGISQADKRIMVSAVVRNGLKVLLLKRAAKNKSYRGCWQLPEGKIEFGETPEATLKRELMEETSLKVGKYKLKGVYSCVASIDGEDYHVLRILYEVDCRGEISLDPEHDKFRWMRIPEAKKLSKKIVGLEQILDSIS